MSFPDCSRWNLPLDLKGALFPIFAKHITRPSSPHVFSFVLSHCRSGTFPVCPMSTTRSPSGRSAMRPLKNWPPRPEWRWRFASPTRSMTWTSEFASLCTKSFDWTPKGKASLSLSLISSLILLRIIELNGGQSPLTYKRFQTLISRMEAVEVPADCITAEVMGKCTTPLSDDHDDKFGVPSLEELGEWRS